MSNDRHLSPSISHGASALVAALVMAVGMGFRRFAFTGIYPVMVSDGLLTVHDGTLAASANYAGYLLGALLATRIHSKDSHRLCLWALVATVVCVAVLALLHTPWLIIVVRGLTGAVSALAMVAASLWLLQHRGHTRGAPLLYAGVGLGIHVIRIAGRRPSLRTAQPWTLARARWRGVGTGRDRYSRVGLSSGK